MDAMTHEGTLERHGIAFRFNGIPWYDDDGNLAGIVNEPWWDEADLTPEQSAELDGWIAEHLAARPQDDPLDVRWGNLEHNGVRHTHRQGAPLYKERPLYGYECSMCRASVINPDPGDSPFYGGPWDGRWIVTNGSATVEVPIIEPISVTVSAETDLRASSMKTATYHRGRDGAYYVDRQSF